MSTLLIKQKYVSVLNLETNITLFIVEAVVLLDMCYTYVIPSIAWSTMVVERQRNKESQG